MKLLTCNTHSIVEENYEKKLSYFVEWVYKNDYDIILTYNNLVLKTLLKLLGIHIPKTM